MSALRTMTCPTCGKRHLIGAPCPTSKPTTDAGRSMSWHKSAVLSLVIIAFTAVGLSSICLAAAEIWSRGTGIAICVIVWIVMQLLRLGYEYDDGIDIKQLLFPAPFDWSVKIERTIHFWTSPQMWFRAIYLGTVIALFIVVITLKSK